MMEKFYEIPGRMEVSSPSDSYSTLAGHVLTIIGSYKVMVEIVAYITIIVCIIPKAGKLKRTAVVEVVDNILADH
jgi:hypothetical protein